MKPGLLILPALTVALSACTSVSVYQTGKTLPKGEAQVGFGMGGGKARSKARIPGFDLELPAVSGDVWGRYGVTSRLDSGLKLSLPGSLTADARYGLLREEEGSAVSVAAGLYYSRASVTTSHTTYDDKADISDLGLPVYISRDLSELVTIYAVPRYVRRFITNERTSTGGAKEYINSDMVGMGGGIMFNLGTSRASHIALELHKVYEPSDPSHYTQNGGISLAIDF